MWGAIYPPCVVILTYNITVMGKWHNISVVKWRCDSARFRRNRHAWFNEWLSAWFIPWFLMLLFGLSSVESISKLQQTL